MSEMSEVWDAIDASQNDNDHLRAALAKAEARIEALETALAAAVRAMAYGGTTYEKLELSGFMPHRRERSGMQTIRSLLAHAAEALGLLDEEQD